MDSRGNLIMEFILETKRPRFLSSSKRLRKKFMGTFEEGTTAGRFMRLVKEVKDPLEVKGSRLAHPEKLKSN
jgi:hypothetical protein